MLLYENKIPQSYRSAFVSKLKEYSTALGIDPNWLMAVINFESAGTFSPSVQNPYSNATGLIQFMPNTAIDLGTSISQLSKMSAVDQLFYVHKYYNRYKSKINSYVDLYLATFFPAAIGKPLEWVVKTASLPASLIASQNPVFDLDNSNSITVGEIEQVMLSKIPSNWQNFFSRNKTTIGAGAILFVAAIIFLTVTVNGNNERNSGSS